MSTLIYVDTNIYLGFLFDRKNEFGRPLGPFAFDVLTRAIHCEFEILITDKIMNELSGNCDHEKTKMLFVFLGKKLKNVAVREEDLKEAEKLDGDNKGDALHAIIARNYKAEYLVTRNIQHFKEFRNTVKCILPENI